MLITPGGAPSSVMESTTLIRTNSTKFVFIQLTDVDGTPIDIEETVDAAGNASGELDLQITDVNGSIIYEEYYWPRPIMGTPRITRVSTGKYQIKYGTVATETSNSGIVLANWHVRQNSTSDDWYKTQVIDIVTPRVLSVLPRFRLILDKSIKIVDLASYCTLGYTDAQLVIYLQSGLAHINEAQPYVMWADLNNFPVDQYWNILGKSALMMALTSQILFSIDTDLPSFSSQGEAFMIAHSPQLKSLRDAISNELKIEIREFKLHFVQSGSISAEMRIGWSFYQMLQTAPNGAVFRNTFTASNM